MTCYIAHVISADAQTNKQTNKRGKRKAILVPAVRALRALRLVKKIILLFFFNVFTSRSAGSARTAGTKIALRFPRLFVCLFVCASALITCAIYYVIRYYATAVQQRLEVCRPSYSKWR